MTQLTTEEWLQVRFDNTIEIAKTKTGSDFDGWIEDGRYLADAIRLARLGQILLDGLKTLDRVSEFCPVRRSKVHLTECPRCRATQTDSCGRWVSAMAAIETIARTATTVPE